MNENLLQLQKKSCGFSHEVGTTMLFLHTTEFFKHAPQQYSLFIFALKVCTVLEKEDGW